MTATANESHSRIQAHVYSFAALLVVVLVTHIPYFSLPYFWDELGQFVPASLDILRAGKLVPVSTVPNVHPPGVMAYLALAWRIAGYSLPVTRVAMLVIAAAGLYFTFLLAIRMCRTVPGTPAFGVVALMLVTPLVYTQSMMAQLDLPAMVFTSLALWLFLERSFIACALACTALVLVKETGAVVPLLCAGWLVFVDKRTRTAIWFVLPFAALAAWLVLLRSVTGNWLGDTGFAHYNVTYSMHPIRMLFALIRRLWFLFGSDFRWIGTVAIFYGLRRTRLFWTREWAFAGLFFAAHLALVTVFGGAALERYLFTRIPRAVHRRSHRALNDAAAVEARSAGGFRGGHVHRPLLESAVPVPAREQSRNGGLHRVAAGRRRIPGTHLTGSKSGLRVALQFRLAQSRPAVRPPALRRRRDH